MPVISMDTYFHPKCMYVTGKSCIFNMCVCHPIKCLVQIQGIMYFCKTCIHHDYLVWNTSLL